MSEIKTFSEEDHKVSLLVITYNMLYRQNFNFRASESEQWIPARLNFEWA